MLFENSYFLLFRSLKFIDAFHKPWLLKLNDCLFEHVRIVSPYAGENLHFPFIWLAIFDSFPLERE